MTISEPAQTEVKQKVRDRRVQLKIKIKDLTHESKLIRHEENKALDQLAGVRHRIKPTYPGKDASEQEKTDYRIFRSKWGAEKRAERAKVKDHTRQYYCWLYTDLRSHRIHELRRAARWTNLAYAFIRGKTYKSVEQSYIEGNEPDIKRVTSVALRFARWTPCIAESTKVEIQAEVEAWFEAE